MEDGDEVDLGDGKHDEYLCEREVLSTYADLKVLLLVTAMLNYCN